MNVTPEVLEHLATKGYDPAFGARPLARLIRQAVTEPLSERILYGALEKGGDVTLILKEDEIDFEVTE